MNILSLFDGMSCGQIAFDKLGIKFDGEKDKYFASEIKNIGIKVTKHNYPNTIHIGDVTKVRYENGVLYTEYGEYETKIDMIIGGSPCFTAGTLVLTNKGYKNIEDIQAGDYVLTHTNTYKKVVVPMRKIADHVYRLDTMFSENLLVTEEHPFYVRERRISNFRKPTWVKAKDLTSDHYVGVAINKESIIPKYADIDFANPNLWWIIGKYLNRGFIGIHEDTSNPNVKSYDTVLYFSKKENKLPEFTQYLDCFTDYEISDYDAFQTITISNKSLYNYLEEFDSIGMADLINLPADLIECFLLGYLSDKTTSDFTEGICDIYDTNRVRLYGIGQCIAKVYNTPFEINPVESINTYNLPLYSLKFRLDKKSLNGAFYEDGYLWGPIYSLNKENYNDTVFNMEVEEDNSYTVNNIIVHNCQNFSTARACRYAIDGLEGDKSKLFYEYLRLLHEINPKYFLLENVKMKKESETQLNEYLGVQGLHINSNLVSFQNRPRIYWTNIPGVTVPEDKKISFQDYKETDIDICKKYKLNRTPSREKMWNNGKGNTMLGSCANVTYADKVYCLTRKQDRAPNSGLVEFEDFARYLTRKELEQAQTIPVGYTDILSYGQMQDLCGDGWTVDVITHILKHIDFDDFKSS